MTLLERLIVEFDKIFLRSPVLPERDISFSAVDLAPWAEYVWMTLE